VAVWDGILSALADAVGRRGVVEGEEDGRGGEWCGASVESVTANAAGATRSLLRE